MQAIRNYDAPVRRLVLPLACAAAALALAGCGGGGGSGGSGSYGGGGTTTGTSGSSSGGATGGNPKSLAYQSGNAICAMGTVAQMATQYGVAANKAAVAKAVGEDVGSTGTEQDTENARQGCLAAFAK